MELTAQEQFAYDKQRSHFDNTLKKVLYSCGGLEVFNTMSSYIVSHLLKDKWNWDVSENIASIIVEHAKSVHMWTLIRSINVTACIKLSGELGTDEYWKMLYAVKVYGLNLHYIANALNPEYSITIFRFISMDSVHLSNKCLCEKCDMEVENDTVTLIKHSIVCSHRKKMCRLCGKIVSRNSSHIESECTQIPMECEVCHAKYKSMKSNPSLGHNLITCRSKMLQNIISDIVKLRDLNEDEKMRQCFMEFSSVLGTSGGPITKRKTAAHGDKLVWTGLIDDGFRYATYQVSLVSYYGTVIRAVRFDLVKK